MSQINVQFAVASHIMAALGSRGGEPIRSNVLAGSVNADPSFVRRVVSKLAKAGLVTTTRGKLGACALARPAAQITLLDIYRASAAPAPAACAMHGYTVSEDCRVSRNIKGCMEGMLQEAQASFEGSLARRTLEEVVAGIAQSP
jgi:Rrf2 family protein